MKATEIREGEEYAYKAAYSSVKRVKALELDVEDTVPLRMRGSRKVRGTRVRFVERSGVQTEVVRNRYLISTWADHVRGEATAKIMREWHSTQRRTREEADARLREIWNGLMDVIGWTDDDHYRHRFSGDSGIVRFSPDTALDLALLLTTVQPGRARVTEPILVASYMADKQGAIAEIRRERDELLDTAERERDEALAALAPEKEETTV